MNRKDMREYRVRFYDDNFEQQEGRALALNGNLTLIEDDHGRVGWRSPSEFAIIGSR